MASKYRSAYYEYKKKAQKTRATFTNSNKQVVSSYEQVEKNEKNVTDFVNGLSLSQKEMALTAIKRKKARENYIDYLKYCYPQYIMTDFHKYLADVMDSVVKRVEKANNPNATQEDIKRGRVRILLSVPPRHGKLLADNTPVLTKNGWKNHGDLVVGDEVINQYGDFVKVVNVFPKYFANRKVVLSNGEEILCHENHEWLVYDRRKHKEVVLETKDMENNLIEKEKYKDRFAYKIPLKKPIKGENKELLVNPYVLGVWLGDGYRQNDHICSCKADIIVLDECRKYYPNGSEWVHKQTGVITRSYLGLDKALHNYGMCFYNKKNIKKIPQEYLTATIEQRLELLAGLLDTDGYLRQKENRYIFTTSDIELRDSFIELVSTFGWRTCIHECKPILSSSGIQGKNVYWQIGFNPTMYIPCRIERKQQHCFSKQRRISIEKIEKIDNVRGNCIQVDGGIYLVGRTMIPTHNSETVTKTLPSWFVGRNPTKNAILTAYNADLAEKFEDSNRQKTRQFGKDIFGIEISESQDNKTLYQTKQGGGVMGVGIQGGITGNGGELIIVDDPYKSSVDANSPATRKLIEDIFRDSIATRLQGKGNALIIIQTRWHEEDLCGKLAKEDGWLVINIPAVCEDEKHDVLHREKGTTLCPELGYDTLWVEQQKKQSGEKVWEALYQGHPSIDGGEVFKRDDIQYYTKATLPPNFDEETISCDLSFGGIKHQNDPCAIQVWGRVGANHYLLKRIKKRLTFNEMCEMIKIISAEFPNARRKIVEKKANGQAVIDSLNSVIGGFEAYDPKMVDKLGRANAITPYFNSKNVFLPDKTIDNSIEEMVDELMKFPNSEHDDEVDAMTQYLNCYQYRHSGKICVDEYFAGIRKAFGGIKI